MHHTVENVSQHQAVCAFKEGVRYRELNLKFGRTGDMSLTRMMEIPLGMLMEKKRIDSAVGRANQSVRTPVEAIPIGNRNKKLSLQDLVKLRQ